MSTAMTVVDFHGDALECATRDGQHYVALRPMCDALGIDDHSQRTKLKGKSWATGVIITLVAEDGKSRAMYCLSLDSVPMWLATIEPSKVKPDSREKLERYQLECARVLRDHFMPATPSQPAIMIPDDRPSQSCVMQARIGDDMRLRDCLKSLCIAAASTSGRSVQSIHGELRKPWGVASIYRIALTSYQHTVFVLNQIIDDALGIKRLPRHKRQLDMPWGETH